MVKIAETLLEFLVAFLIVYLIYYFTVYKKAKEYNRKKAPANVKYLVYKYKIDVAKFDYKELIKRLMLADSFIVATIFVAPMFISNFYIRLLVSFVLIFPAF